MSFAGHVSAMLASLKNNKLPKREQKLGHIEYKKGVPIGEPLRFKNSMSEAELIKFRQELQQQKTRVLKRTVWISIGSILLVTIIALSYL